MKIDILSPPKAGQFAAECATIHASAFAPTGARSWTVKEFEDLLERKTILLLREEHSFLLVEIIQGEAEILTLAVHPDKQNQGFAGYLLQNFFEECATYAVRQCILEVAEDNSAAIKLYQRFNFETITIRKNYFKRKTKFVSAFVMKKCFFNQKN